MSRIVAAIGRARAGHVTITAAPDLIAESRLSQAWAAATAAVYGGPSALPRAYGTTPGHLDPYVFGSCGCRDMCKQ